MRDVQAVITTPTTASARRHSAIDKEGEHSMDLHLAIDPALHGILDIRTGVT